MDAVEVLHSRPEPFHGRLQEQVVVVGHQAEGVDDPVETVHALGEELEEAGSIRVVPLDVAPVDAASRDVEDPIGQLRP